MLIVRIGALYVGASWLLSCSALVGVWSCRELIVSVAISSRCPYPQAEVLVNLLGATEDPAHAEAPLFLGRVWDLCSDGEAGTRDS